MKQYFHLFVISVNVMLGFNSTLFADDPPAINPFRSTTVELEDARPGYVELSDGAIYPGQIYLTRDKRLKIADEQSQRQREIPLSAVKQIECTIKKQWMEKEWKFKESAKDEKTYAGRSYPVREYGHTVTIQDGKTITGGLSVIVYVQSGAGSKAEQFILHKRDKGEIGGELQSLVYVKTIKLGKDALQEGKQKAAEIKKTNKKN